MTDDRHDRPPPPPHPPNWDRITGNAHGNGATGATGDRVPEHDPVPEHNTPPLTRDVPDVPDVPDVQGVGGSSGPTDATDLVGAIESFLGRYVAFPSEHGRVAAVLWAVHAHLVDAFDSTPRLALLSPEPGSGKTRVLEVLELLTPAAMHVLSASTPAIFRSIDGAEPIPTLLFDEVDAIFGRSGKSDDNEDLRALLNAGHRNGATIPRCHGPTHQVKQFPVYAATALAGLGDLPDTLMSRSVVIRMRRRRPSEQVEPFRYRIAAVEGHELRDGLAAWADRVSDHVVNTWPDMPDGIEDRPADVWEPLLAVADAVGGTWPARARAACVALAEASVSREASLGIRLLSDVKTVFDGADRMGTGALLAGLHALDESPWADLRGKPLDARGLAWRLGHYEISSTKVRIGDRTLQGYQVEHLYDAWARYCPTPPPEDPEHPEHPEQTRSEGVPAVPDASGVPEHEAAPEQPEPDLGGPHVRQDLSEPDDPAATERSMQLIADTFGADVNDWIEQNF